MPTAKHLLVIASLSLLGNAALAAGPETAGGFQIGVLTCNSQPGTQKNLIIASKVAVDCTLKYNNGNLEHYVGETGIGVGVRAIASTY